GGAAADARDPGQAGRGPEVRGAGARRRGAPRRGRRRLAGRARVARRRAADGRGHRGLRAAHLHPLDRRGREDPVDPADGAVVDGAGGRGDGIAAATRPCPSCGTPLTVDGEVRSCPRCGDTYKATVEQPVAAGVYRETVVMDLAPLRESAPERGLND